MILSRCYYKTSAFSLFCIKIFYLILKWKGQLFLFLCSTLFRGLESPPCFKEHILTSYLCTEQLSRRIYRVVVYSINIIEVLNKGLPKQTSKSGLPSFWTCSTIYMKRVYVFFEQFGHNKCFEFLPACISHKSVSLQG